MKPIFIVGPTGIGKTDISIELAKKTDAAIISADSVQIYKMLNIGTGKPDKKDIEDVNFYLVNHINPKSYYSAYNFFLDVKEILKKIKKNIIISGGTGLFVEALIRGIAPSIPRSDKLRDEIREKAAAGSWEELYSMLKEVDPDYADKISKNDKIRITRALEIYFSTGKTVTSLNRVTKNNRLFTDYRLFNLTCPRELLYERVNKRIDNWFNSGWIDEVELLYRKKIIDENSKPLGFKEIIKFLKGEIKTRKELIETVKKTERNYAKRQITWFKRYKERIDIEATFNIKNDTENILKHLGGRYGC
jgi:tRNA dimethylallyltransferase